MAGALDTLTSNILPGESGGVPTDLPVEAAPTKGALQSPTDFATIKGPKGTSMVLDPTSSEQILANMQDFINQRTNKSKLDTFSDALTRSHMLIHPEALTQYDKAQEDKAKETYDMQMQLAQYKAALAEQKAFGEFRKGLYGTTAAPAGTEAAGTAGPTSTAPAGAAGTAGTAPSVVKTTAGQSFSFNQLPPEIQASALGQRSYDGFQKVIDTWAEKHAEAAQKLSNDLTVEEKKHGYALTEEENKFLNSGEAHKQYDWYNENTGKLEKRTPYEVKMRGLDSTLTPTQPIPGYVASSTPATGQGGYKGVAADVNNPVGIGGAGNFTKYETPQDGVKAAIDLNTRYVNGQGPMAGVAPTVENMTSVWVNGKPGTNPPGYSTFVKQELAKAGVKLNADSTVPNTPEAIKALTAARIKFESGKNAGKFLPYLDSAPAATPSAAVPTTPAAAAPTAPTAAAPTAAAPTAGKSFGEFQQEQEAQKAATAAEMGVRGKDAGLRYAAIVQGHQTADSDLASAQYIKDIINTNPNAVGVLAHPGVLQAIGSLIQGGAEANATAGGVGASGGVHMKNIEDAIRKVGGTQADIDAAQKLAQKFAELQLNTARAVLKGQGSVSDNERQLVANMTGNISNTPAALRDMLRWGEMNAKYNKVLGNALENWERDHPNVPYRQFELTPEYKQIRADHEIEYSNFVKTVGNYTPPKPNQKITLPAGVTQERYNAWKAQQRTK